MAFQLHHLRGQITAHDHLEGDCLTSSKPYKESLTVLFSPSSQRLRSRGMRTRLFRMRSPSMRASSTLDFWHILSCKLRTSSSTSKQTRQTVREEIADRRMLDVEPLMFQWARTKSNTSSCPETLLRHSIELSNPASSPAHNT